MEESKTQDYIYKATLLKRDGWTQKAIDLFLPIHDKDVKNPYYRNAAPSKLYLLSKVELVEANTEFTTFVEKNKKRVESSKKSIETRRENLLNYVENVAITIPDIPKDVLLQESCDHYNDWNYEKQARRDNHDFQMATLKSDEVFLKRITLNYLRHQLTCYEEELDNLFGKVGTDDAYWVLKHRINDAILEKYDFLN